MPRGETASKDAAPDSDALVGRVLGEFTIRERLGSGGFGTVYRAEQTALGREAVVKVLHDNTRKTNETDQRFLREARLAAALDHPFAAHIYAFGAEADGLLWMAMELVRGTPLNELLKAQGTLPLPRLVGLLERLCDVVHTAHEQGIIHRDIKPANVMVISRAGKLLPKLLDLGIAKVGLGTSAAAMPDLSLTMPDRPVSPDDATSEVLTDSTSRDLTRRGAIMGSPLSMAPEQWVDAASTDARTDVYALGVLAYTALTGTPPFNAKTVHGLARAHAKEPVPPLPDGLPPALNAVFARAMAKRPGDRFPTAVEFAAAMRSAAELEATAVLPRLDRGLTEMLFAQAPQMLAECVAVLDSSRSAKEAHEAAQRIALASAMHVGALALGARMRVGPGDREDSPDALAAMRQIRKGALDAKQWLELATELVRPFAQRPEVHPLPELVALLSAATPEAGSHPLDGLCENFEGEGEAFVPPLRRLEASLRALAPLFAYRLAVPRDSQAELWIGLRSQRRSSVPYPQGTAETELQPVLLDTEGSAAVQLWPFVQMRSPAPGAAEELFYLEGNGRFGAKLLSLPQAFERHDPSLWTWIERRVDGFAPDRAASGATGLEETPYMGLSSFELKDASRYFGREREAEGFANRLRAQTLLAVVGPSGVGKSSFVQAGVLPLLPVGARTITVRPGSSPLLALASKLATDPFAPKLEPTLLAAELRADPKRLRVRLGELASSSRSPFLLLVVDQFEELVTLCNDEEERRLFTAALTSVAEAPIDAKPALRIVLTLRDDFLMRVQQLPALRESLTPGLQLLATPVAEDLRRILIEPARLAGYEFDDPSLPDEMVRSVSKESGALALLSFTASKLWDLRDRQLRRLTRKAYLALGGVGGALGQHAEETLGRMAASGQKQVREAFRHLVTSQGTRAVVTRADMEHLLAPDPNTPQRTEAKAVIEQLIGARLLVASEGAHAGEDRLEVIHEALLISWPRLVKWQREDAESARLRDQLRAAARQWDERGRPRGLLWRKEPLLEYRLWRSRYASALTPVEEAFASASVRDETRGRRFRQGLLIAAFVALLMGSTVLYRARAQAEQNAARAKAQVIRLYEEQGRQRLLAGDPLRGLAFLDASAEQGGEGASLAYLFTRGRERLNAQVAALPHPAAIYSVALSPDDRTVASTAMDGVVRLWDGKPGSSARELLGHSGTVYSARFSTDGERLVTSGQDGTARVWDVRTGATLTVVGGGDKGAPELLDARLDPSGRMLLTGGRDGIARLYSAGGGAPLRTESLLPKNAAVDPEMAARRLTSVAFSPDGRRWAAATLGGVVIAEGAQGRRVWAPHAGLRGNLTFSPDGRELAVVESQSIRLLDAVTGKSTASLDTGAEAVALVYAPDGARLYAAASRKEVLGWELPSRRPLPPFIGHSADLHSIALSGDGRRLASVGVDGTARIWDPSTGLLLRTLYGHLDVVRRASFGSTAGDRLATLSLDGTVRTWDVRGAEFVHRFPAEAPVFATSYSPDGSMLLTAGQDGWVRIWNTADGSQIRAFRPGAPEILTAAWSPDGERLVAGEGETFSIWRARKEGEPTRVRPGAGRIYSLAWSTDGQIASAHEDGTIHLWNSDGTPRRVLKGHDGLCDGVAWSADGKRLASVGVEGAVRLWDGESGAPSGVLSGHAGLVSQATFSRDGQRLISAGSDRRAVIWDLATGRTLVTLEGHDDALITAAISPDGTRALTTSLDGTLRVWDAQRGTLLDVIPTRGPAQWGELSPDGTMAAVGEGDGARLWRVEMAPLDLEAVRAYSACHVPYEVAGETLRLRTLKACGR